MTYRLREMAEPSHSHLLGAVAESCGTKGFRFLPVAGHSALFFGTGLSYILETAQSISYNQVEKDLERY